MVKSSECDFPTKTDVSDDHRGDTGSCRHLAGRISVTQRKYPTAGEAGEWSIRLKNQIQVFGLVFLETIPNKCNPNKCNQNFQGLNGKSKSGNKYMCSLY